MKTIIQTPTPDILKSIDFYRSLDFKILKQNEKTFACSNGFFIEINPSNFSRTGIKFYRDNWIPFIEEHHLTDKATATENGFLITSPSGCCVFLEKEDAIVNMSKTAATSKLGQFGGLSLETNLMEDSVSFWNQFDFEKTSGDFSQGWVSLSNKEGFTISLMKYNCCPHLFFNPSLNFFNGKENLKIIAEIKNSNIPITQEITHFNTTGIVDNIIVTDPGGLGFFIFND